MEVIASANTNTAINNNNTHTNAKSPEPESETPTRIHQTPTNTKPLSFSNGVLKRHYPHHHHPPFHHANQPITVTYKECLKNHVASLGGHALDGCGEFMPSPAATPDDPSSIKCAACGCHRNFHRREPEEPQQPISPVTHHHVLEYQPHHRHHPPPPPHRSPNSASPPPISSYPSAPHMLLALSGGLPIPPENTASPAPLSGGTCRKRFRTKFTPEQKEKMHEFAEKVGWKMQKRDEEMVMEFCNDVGVDRGVLKVWMHNNKNTFGKKDNNVTVSANGGGAAPPLVRNVNVSVLNGGINGNGNEGNGNNNNNNLGSQDQNQYENDSGTNVGTNGSSSSS
ncbi:hypothetical protein RJT34_27989 [Clitoria ternatea]|uniref:ZF-HD dimerization-type domain-containing protein n=1 Tax=Clitoria ternatea TaxID=43366 RepID=A0AAN9IB97_CLITE